MKIKKYRYWEVDILRLLAIMIMIAYHFSLDVNHLFHGTFKIPLSGINPWVFYYNGNPTWIIRPNIIFLLLVGMSMTLAYNGLMKKGLETKQIFNSFFKKGRNIFLIGLLFTTGALVSYSYHKHFLIFGILHLIGFTLIVCFPFIKWRFRSLLLGIAIIVIGMYLRENRVEWADWYLWWIGILPTKTRFIDHFPIFPKLGFVFIGIFLGNLLYKNGERQFPWIEFENNKIISILQYIGQKSLWIYLLHQPILTGILSVVKFGMGNK